MTPATAPASVPPPWTLYGDAIGVVDGRGILAFIRHAESNVGPHEELLWLAPFGASPQGRRHRVAQFWPSQAPDFRLQTSGFFRERIDRALQGSKQVVALFIEAGDDRTAIDCRRRASPSSYEARTPNPALP